MQFIALIPVKQYVNLVKKIPPLLCISQKGDKFQQRENSVK